MEDYFYILAGAAYLVYSVYSAKQKQNNKKQQAVQQPYEETELEEPIVEKEPTSSIFNEILGIQNFDSNTEEELYAEEEKEPTLDVIPPVKGVRTTTTVQEKQDEIDEQEEAIRIAEEKKKSDFDFNLRDAVISSEILNPPYINR